MRFAIGLPNVKEYADPGLTVDLAVAAEAAGWDGVFVWDHLLYRSESDPVSDPWTTVAAVAQATERVRLGVMVAALARRRPWVVARQAVTIDHLSGGRLIFGAGLGSLESEFALFGENAGDRERADKLDESLDVIAGLWSGEEFRYAGRHYNLDPVRFAPQPVQEHIPVWIAGRWPSKRPFRRAARWDGVFATHRSVAHDEMMDVTEFSAIVEYTQRHRPDDATPFDVVMEGQTTGTRDDERTVRSYEEAGLTWWVEKLGWFRGTVDDMATRIQSGPPV